MVVSLEGEFHFCRCLPGPARRNPPPARNARRRLSPEAYIFGAEFTRESTPKEQEERLKQAIVQYEQDVQRAAVNRARNVTRRRTRRAQRQKRSPAGPVARLRRSSPPAASSSKCPKPRPSPTCPRSPSRTAIASSSRSARAMVSVFGTVLQRILFPLPAGQELLRLPAQAGGPRKEADKGSIYVLRADGSVISKRNTGFLFEFPRQHAADARRCHRRARRLTRRRGRRTSRTGPIFYQFGLGVAALQVIKNY